MAFERKVADEFNSAKIRAPIHLHGGNENELINIFSSIKSEDWIFLLAFTLSLSIKGVPEKQLFSDICNGKSITLLYPEYRIYTSAIVGSIIPIALGAAKSIQLDGSDKTYLPVYG